MGTDIHLAAVAAPAGALERATQRVDALERSWSRFLPESELCQLNRGAGHPVLVSQDTFDLVALAVEAWWATGGRFDPTVLPALEAAGYDRSFELVTGRGEPRGVASAAPGCARIDLDPILRAIVLPPGVRLDLGGIGKGRAADLVAAQLVSEGATGACVNIGGDIAVAGDPPAGDEWAIAVDDSLDPGADACMVHLASGGVATSTPLRRRWQRGQRTLHHLIDPTTGEPADTGIAAVTVVAGSAAWAEALTKAAYLAGVDDGADLLASANAHGVFLLDNGELAVTDGMVAAS